MTRAVVMLLCVWLLGGCAFKGGPGAGDALADASEAWQPRPTSIRVYPTTRFVRAGAQSLLEARIELMDEMGDAVKGAGEFRVEMLDADEATGMPGRQLYVWRVPVMTLEDQRRFYDPITRTYLLRLRLDEAALAAPNVVVQVVFMPAGGGRLTGQATVSTSG
jgi:hypothetical protein